ncbi:hypothetical protein M0208_00725 [Sphingomonas sp. SUN019]|uniref:hypothetical protein n=1 Tax=Sphingomonas sp. SUN019 TaxID=2937788 RepID=UPI002164C924|nr:hypothetical protein [Sphingomonas sp. SUN019]UVO49115.1 hypothetical protein M0208_00725 [Sphingomonas sp. SUN019]
MKRFIAPFALPILIAACASPGEYPSLLPRGAERAGFEEPAPPPPVAAAPDPALDARIATVRQKSTDAAGRFDAAATKAGQTVRAARGAAAGSDAWLDAQTALAGLDVLRAETLEELTDLEQLASERALALTAEYPALNAAIAAARTAADEQAKRIAALQAMLTPA